MVSSSSDVKMAESMEASSAASGLKDSVGLTMSERPTCILCLGMAGSGKTTFVQVSSLVNYEGIYRLWCADRDVAFSCFGVYTVDIYVDPFHLEAPQYRVLNLAGINNG